MLETGGVDSYTNAISDIYQDNFGEGIFTGKGIYDLEVFCKTMKNKIPDNTVLSHDLLEGCISRCGLGSDMMILDGFPTSYSSYLTRMERWIRGDWQIISWLKKSYLNKLSKYKLLDNLRRSMIEIFAMLNLVFLSIIHCFLNVKVLPFEIITLLSATISSVLDILNYIIFRKENIKTQKKFTKRIDGMTASIYRGVIAILTLPNKAYISLKAIIKTIYRMYFSKGHLLEWTTAEEAEKKNKNNLKSMYMEMKANVVFGVLGIIFAIINIVFRNVENVGTTIIRPADMISLILIMIFSVIWLFAPFIMWNISRKREEKKSIEKLNKEEQEYIRKIAEKTWKFFAEYMNKENNYLPPDNYQESRREKTVHRTSSTNIGLGLLTIISAYDLKFITLEKALSCLENVMDTIQTLEKWNGHLYNWYDTKTLKPLIPRYISTVDSGNFVGYMYTLRGFLEEKINTQYKDRIRILLEITDKIIKDTDFSYLYSKENRLLSIGFNIEDNKLTETYYDLLASEARQASLIAIAKRDVEAKHWNNLSRTLTKLDKYKGLVSWSGTAFEYLMPNINIKRYKGSLLDESCKFMIMSQKRYAARLRNTMGDIRSGF